MMKAIFARSRGVRNILIAAPYAAATMFALCPETLRKRWPSGATSVSAVRRLAVRLGAGVVMTTATVSLLLTAAAPATEAGAPPPLELITYEQKAEALHVNSIRFTANFDEDLDVKATSVSLPLDFIIDGGGEASALPKQAVIRFEGLGKGIEVRVVGGKTYVHKPGNAERDGGRPWVVEAEGLLSRWDGVDPYGLMSGIMGSLSVGAAGGGEEAIHGSGSFAQLSGVLAEAQSTKDVGSEIVNGQQATEFSATLDPRALLSKLSTKVLAELEKDTEASGSSAALGCLLGDGASASTARSGSGSEPGGTSIGSCTRVHQRGVAARWRASRVITVAWPGLCGLMSTITPSSSSTRMSSSAPEATIRL